MIKADVKDITGKKVGSETLDPLVFEIKIKPEIIQHVITAYQANRRRTTAQTKDRSEVRGGGKKPWRQKGTGRARHGSIRSPLWKGGGVTFGPSKDRNYSQKMNRKVRRLALLMSLSDRARNKKITLIDKIELSRPKTKIIAEMLKALKLKKTLIVIGKKDVNIQRSAQNIPTAKLLAANSLNALTLVKYPNIIITLEALKIISSTFKS